jgi:hypothetical protein
MGRTPAASKHRTLCASASKSPDAYPWYALSNSAVSRRWAKSRARSSHWDGEGSIPVGLWAHAWSSTVEPAGTASSSPRWAVIADQSSVVPVDWSR